MAEFDAWLEGSITYIRSMRLLTHNWLWPVVENSGNLESTEKHCAVSSPERTLWSPLKMPKGRKSIKRWHQIFKKKKALFNSPSHWERMLRMVFILIRIIIMFQHYVFIYVFFLPFLPFFTVLDGVGVGLGVVNGSICEINFFLSMQFH